MLGHGLFARPEKRGRTRVVCKHTKWLDCSMMDDVYKRMWIVESAASGTTVLRTGFTDIGVALYGVDSSLARRRCLEEERKNSNKVNSIEPLVFILELSPRLPVRQKRGGQRQPLDVGTIDIDVPQLS
jgi:hypothetical protein